MCLFPFGVYLLLIFLQGYVSGIAHRFRSKRDLETSGGQDYSGTPNQQHFNRQYFVSQCKAHYSTAVAVITHL